MRHRATARALSGDFVEDDDYVGPYAASLSEGLQGEFIVNSCDLLTIPALASGRHCSGQFRVAIFDKPGLGWLTERMLRLKVTSLHSLRPINTGEAPYAT